MKGFVVFVLLFLITTLLSVDGTRITINLDDQTGKSGKRRVTSMTNSHTRTKLSSAGNQISNKISQDNLHTVEHKEAPTNYFRKSNFHAESVRAKSEERR